MLAMWTPLAFSFIVVSAGQIIITAEPGENVTLPCRADKNKDVIIVEWRRTDLGLDQYVLLYRDTKFDPEGQSPSFSDRVDLLDMKNGDVSLVLKNVTTDDTGTYECRVDYSRNNRRKRSHLGGDPISIINLRVEPGNDEDGGNEDGQKKNGRSWPGLIVSLSMFAVVVLVVVVVSLCRKPRNSPQRSASSPEPEAELEQIETEL